MKILLTSAGRRGYLVKYFKQALGNNGEVWGADSSQYTPAFQYCDKAFLLPEVNEPNYLDKVIGLCNDNKIDIVIPLIDPELIVMAQQRQRFYDEDITVVVSPLKTIRISFDKYLTYQFGKDNGIAVPKTFIDIDEALRSISSGELNWPLLVKPRKGSASLGIIPCQNECLLKFAFENCPQPMIQQYINGDEYGYDTFCDFDFRPISVFCKKKLMMRSGETDKAISTNDPQLVDFGLKIAQNLQIFGPADLDVIMDKDGPKLLEINPRFGGGYPCSHLAGADFPAKLIAIRKGQKLTPDIGSCPAGIVMLKQDEIISLTNKKLKSI
jgi:carbamoyl-phosphate synthase large subunit